MKKVINTLKLTLLLGALTIIAWSAGPSSAQASAFCEVSGHSCHAIIDGVTHHMELQKQY